MGNLKNILEKSGNYMPFLKWGKKVSKETIKADLIAGATGAVIVLPQGVAFATIAGLPPEYGLYTAMITPIIAALFGSSMHLISGPTTAISLVLFATISQFATPGSDEFISLALTLTFLAGVYQLGFGLAKLGKLVDFVSHTVVIGFTAGASILIVTSQMKNILGLDLSAHGFYETWQEIIYNLGNINIWALLIGLFTLSIALFSKKIFPKFPNLLVALILGSLFAVLLKYSFNLDLNFIKFVPEIPSKLPSFGGLDLSYETITALAPSAFAVAILGLIEAVSISRSISSKSHQKINSNQEFIGQGMSNIAGSFFSSYAGSGSFTRSGVNYAAGAKTPMSAIFAAIFLAIIVLLVAPVTKYLPISAMAGVILLVGYNLIDFSKIKDIFQKSISESTILMVTFLSTLFLELEFAIYLGIITSLMIFLNKTSQPNIVTLLSNYDEKKGKKTFVGSCRVPLEKREDLQCPQLKILRIDMSIYFGSVNYISDFLNKVIEKEGIKEILIVGTGVNFLDMAGAEMLEEQGDILKELGGGLYFVDFKSTVYNDMKKYGLLNHVGEDHFFFSKKGAIEYLYNHKLDKDICTTCKNRVFTECGGITNDYSKAPDIKDLDYTENLINKIKNIFR